MTKILEQAKAILFLSLALFFLVSSGLVVRLYWAKGPLDTLSEKLLEKDGRLLVSILSNGRTVGAIRAMTAPASKAPKAPKSAAHYLIDRLLDERAKLLHGISGQLLKQPSIQALLRPAASGGKARPSPLDSLGRYAIDRLLAHKGEAARHLLAALLQATGSQGPPSPGTQKASDPWPAIERLGKYAIDRIFEKKGALALKLSQGLLSAVAPKSKAKGASSGPKWERLLDGLGKHAIDRLAAGRALPLRAILQDMLGPEPRRTMQALRQVTHQITQQFTRIHISQLVREAAYQLGRGGLEAFLQEQQKQARQAMRIRHKLENKARTIAAYLRQKHPCFVPKPPRWLSYRKGEYRGKLHFLTRDAQCTPARCKRAKDLIKMHLDRSLRAVSAHPDDIFVEVSPACESLQRAPLQRLTPKPRKKAAKAPTPAKARQRPTAPRK